MKRKSILLVLTACLLALLCSACSSGTPLAKAAKKLEKAGEEGYYRVLYIEEDDMLVIRIRDVSDLDGLFEILNKEIEGEDIGTILFDNDRSNGLKRDTCNAYCDKIAELPCNSMKILGVGPALSEYMGWMPAAEKAGLVYMPALVDPTRAEDKGFRSSAPLESIKRLWIFDVHLSMIGYYPNVEEIGIDAYIFPDESLWSEAAEESSGDDAEEEPKGATFKGGSVLKSVETGSNVKKLLIAPTASFYDLDDSGSAYLFTLQKQYPELLVNAPETPIEIDPTVPVDESLLVPVKDVSLPNLTQAGKEDVIRSFLWYEVNDVYEKAVKMKASSDKPVIRGKSLIALVDPDQLNIEIYHEDSFWPTKREWNNSSLMTKILLESDVDGKIPTPEGPGDYETFIYIYPVYVLYGSYDSGTEAYTMTYRCQIFDLKNGIAYEPETFASAGPSQKIYYGSTPQLKASGKVEASEVYAYIKKLKAES